MAESLATLTAAPPQLGDSPPLRALFNTHARSSVLCLCRGVGVVSNGVCPATPADVVHAHTALGVVVTLLHRSPEALGERVGEPSVGGALVACCAPLLARLPPPSRDAALTAAVVLTVAATARLAPAAAARVMGEALFGVPIAEEQPPPPQHTPLVPGGAPLRLLCSGVSPFGRLCFLRALLAALPRDALTAPLPPPGNDRYPGGSPPWTLLVGGIIPELLAVGEAGGDAHARHHSCAGLALAAQRASDGGRPPLPPALAARMHRLAWAGWEDDQACVVRSCRSLFDALVQSRASDPAQPAMAALSSLQSSGLGRSAWPPLGSLVATLGANALLAAWPTAVHDALAATQQEPAAAAAAGFVRSLCASLAEGGEGCDAVVARLVPPLAAALRSRAPNLRSHVGCYALPPLLLSVPGLGVALAAALLRPTNGDGDDTAASVVTLLRAARGCGLTPPGECLRVLPSRGSPAADASPPPPPSLLRSALRHPRVRMEAIELLCVASRGAELPGVEEAALLRHALAAALQPASAAARNRTAAAIRRLLARLRAGLARAAPQPGETAAGRAAAAALPPWLASTACAAAYPGAPFGRKYAALDAVVAVCEAWGGGGEGGGEGAPAALLGPAGVAALLAAGVDSWDRCRDKAGAAVMLQPSPLPGLATPAALSPLLAWLRALLSSPRVRESDAAAQMLRTLTSCYVVKLRWRLGEHPTPPPPGPLPPACAASAVALRDLVDAVAVAVEAAEACGDGARTAACHGPLLSLRLALPALRLGAPDAGDAAAEAAAAAEVCTSLARLLCLCERVLSLSLSVVARPDALGVDAAEVLTGPSGGVGWGAFFGDGGDDECGDGGDGGDGGDSDTGGEGAPAASGDALPSHPLAPRAQVVMTAAWLAAKEACLVIGELATSVPPSLLPRPLLASPGSALLRVLLSSKHNGVVDKARGGLCCVAGALLRCGGAPATHPRAWVATLLATLSSPGQGVRDLIRRSAGLPAGLLALACAEPPGRSLLLPSIIAACLDATRSGGTHVDCVPCVHGLNVLRILVCDHSLAADTQAALAPAASSALSCFASPHWHVRNGAGLLWCALCVRLTGALNPGVGQRASTTAADAHARHPTLLPSLAAALGTQRGALPALALLSRLRPCEGVQGGGDDAAHQRLWDAVEKWATGSGDAVRCAAAAALPPLIAPSRAPAAACDLLARLAPPGAPSNALHGALLCAKSLLASACAHGGAGGAGAPSPAVPLLPALRELSRLRSHPAPPVRAAHVSLLLAALTRGGGGEEAGALLEHALAVHPAPSPRPAPPACPLPGAAVAVKRSVVAACTAALWATRAHSSPADAGAVDRAASVCATHLRCGDGIRVGASLKALQSCCEAAPLHTALLSLLAPRLVAVACDASLPPKCAARAAELLCCVPPDVLGPLKAAPQLAAALDAAREPRAQCAAIAALAAAVGVQPCEGGGGGGDVCGCGGDGCGCGDDPTGALLSALSRTSAPSCPCSLRCATASCLRPCGLLKGFCFPVWRVAATLLEDEDDAARGDAAAAVQSVLGRRDGGDTDAVLAALFSHVAERFSTHTQLLPWLAACVAAPGGAQAAARPTASLARRLFEREADNHRAEALRTAQLAARALRSLVATQLGEAQAAQLVAARDANAAACASVAGDMRRLAGFAWAGGLTNHEQFFLATVAALTGAWALSEPGCAPSECVRRGVGDLTTQLANMPLHPVARGVAQAALRALGMPLPAELAADGESVGSPTFLIDEYV